MFTDDYGILLIRDDPLGRGAEVHGYIRHPKHDDIVLCSVNFVTWQKDTNIAHEYAMHYLKKMAEAVLKQSIDEVLAEIEEARKKRNSIPYQDQ